MDYNSNGTVADEYSRDDTASPGASYTSWAEITNTYDHDSQLTNTSYTSFVNAPSSGTQSFDSNGNCTNVSVPAYLSSNTGAGNRLLFDGTYTYAYDANGNRTLQWVNNNGVKEGSPQAGDTDITVYTWDNRNQLTSVKTYTTYANWIGNTVASSVSYGYDAFGDMVSQTPSAGSAEYYVNDGSDLYLVLNSAAQVTERELYAAAVDQVLASETVTPSSGGGTQSAGTVNWLLGDSQGTVRDVAQYTSGSGGGTSIVDHVI